MIEASDVQILTDPVDQAVCPKCSHKMDVQGLPSFSSLVCAKCGYELTVPARLGHFLLLKIIGMGGMGGVYRAHDEVLNRDVAIKVMRKSLGDNQKFSETFLREAQAAARINHPNIVQIYAFGKEKGQPYIVMELVLGGGLDRVMEGNKALDQTRVMRIAEQVADGLRHASDEGMVHGDVKPENILLSEGKVPKLVDFGLASVSGTASNEIWGTPFYIAPEKVRRQKTDHRADIYSLGGTLYHALAGRPPFDGTDANAVVRARFTDSLVPLTEVRPGIDPEISAIISRMLLNEPSLRYPTYGSLLSDIRRVLERLGPEEVVAPVSKKIVLRRKGKPTPASAGAEGVGTGSEQGQPSSSSTQVPSEKKIVIGRGVMVASGHQSTMMTGNLASSASISSDEMAPVADDPARRMRMVRLIAGLAVLGLLAIFGGLYGLVKWGQSSAARKTREQERQVQQQQDAVFGLRGVAERAQRMATECAAEAEKGKTLTTELAAQAMALISEEMHPYLIPPRPAPPPSEVEEEAAAPAAPPAAGLSPDLLAKAAAAVAAAGLPITPENIATFAKTLAAADPAVAAAPTNDVAAAGAEPEAPAAADAPPADAAAADPAVVAAAPLEESAMPPVVQRIRAMFKGVYELERAAEIAAQLADTIAIALQVPDIPKRPLAAVQALHAELTRTCDEVAAQSPVADIGRIMRGITADREAALQLLNDIKANLTRQEREAQARAAADQEQVDKQRQEQERLARIQAELGSVAGAEAGNVERLRILEFRQAARALRNLDERIGTPEGKAALALAQEKITRIEAFYQFLGMAADGVTPLGNEAVEADRPIAAFRHPTLGWTVQSSDAKGLTVGGKTVKWQDVDDVTKVMLIRHLLKDDKQVTALRFRYRIQQYINAALFLEMFITNSPVVREMAVSLAQEAVTMFPRSREDIDRLIPGLLKSEG